VEQETAESDEEQIDKVPTGEWGWKERPEELLKAKHCWACCISFWVTCFSRLIAVAWKNLSNGSETRCPQVRATSSTLCAVPGWSLFASMHVSVLAVLVRLPHPLPPQIQCAQCATGDEARPRHTDRPVKRL